MLRVKAVEKILDLPALLCDLIHIPNLLDQLMRREVNTRVVVFSGCANGKLNKQTA